MDMHFDGVIFQTYADELARRTRYSHPPFQILDVRDAAEFSGGHIPGAVLAQAAGGGPGLPDGTTPTTEFFVVGAGPNDERVRQTSLSLRKRGAQRCVELPGGMVEWRQAGLPVEN